VCVQSHIFILHQHVSVNLVTTGKVSNIKSNDDDDDDYDDDDDDDDK